MPVRPLTSLPAGAEVLIDVNVLVYGLLPRSAQCERLLQRCVAREIAGFTTVETLADTCHKLMLTEAASKGLISRQNSSNLQGKADVIKSLTDYWRLTESIRTFSVTVWPLDEFRFRRAHIVRQSTGLMTNDSILLAAADVFGIASLATNDADFDSVTWLTVYKPTDVI